MIRILFAYNISWAMQGKRMMKKTEKNAGQITYGMKPLIAVVLVSFSLLIQAELLYGAGIIKSPHFEVRYTDIGEKYVELVSQSAERSFEVITGFFGHTPENTIIIILTDTDDEFRTLTRGTLPDWSAAVATGNRIIISPLPQLNSP